MKKTYVKPQLWKESFQPADAIAGNCETDVGFGPDTCTYWSEKMGSNLFTAANDSCNDQWIEGQGDDLGCYHMPTESLNYFGS